MKILLSVFFYTCVIFAQPAPRLAIVGGPQQLWPRITTEFAKRYPGREIQLLTTAPTAPVPVDIVFAYYPTPEELQASLSYLPDKSLAQPQEFAAPLWRRTIDPQASVKASAYLDEGGVENGVRLVAYLCDLVRPNWKLSPEAPLKGPQSGIYHPDAEELFSSFEAYRNWWLQRAGRQAAPPAVALAFFSSWLRGRDLAVVDAGVRKLEARGYLPIPVFGYPTDRFTPLLQHQGNIQPAAVITLNATLSSVKDADIYTSWKVPVFNGLVTRDSLEQWQSSPKGLAPDRIAPHLSFPERSGLVAPTLVATTESSANGAKMTLPFHAGLDSLLDRVSRWIALQTKPNSSKRVAVIYYNNPAGKGNVGASYLQVFPSIANILSGLEKRGYQVSHPLPDETVIRRLIENNGRNLELWAEGEKERLGHSGDPVLWPLEEYRKHYDLLPQSFRDQVEATWGAPGVSRLMTTDCHHSRCFLLPAIEQGNLLLAPQPLRTTSDQASDPGHVTVTPPPHQYIAFYLWLRHVWAADSVIHLGRHGTLEWLPGKQVALAPDDAPALVLGDLPNFNVYVMDGGGEAIQAKRRGFATLISHLTPMIWRTGGRAEFEKLHLAFHELVDRGDSLAPNLAREYEKVAREEVKRLGLDRQLQLDTTGSWTKMSPALHRFLHEIEDAPLPAGLPVFGSSPTEERLKEAVSAYLFSSFPKDSHDTVEPSIPIWAEELLAGREPRAGELSPELTALLAKAAKALPAWIAALRSSGPAEIEGLANALDGRHVPSNLLGDPLRKPESLPVGQNLHAVDAARIPTEAAWVVGQQMAKEFLQRYQETHHQEPKRVSLVLWYGETERHQGAMECMALALLGVQPVWNQRGVVEDLKLIPRESLGRDRVDVVFTVSGNYRDGFADKLHLLDKAIRLAASAADQTIADQDRKLAAQMQAQGVGAEDAAKLSKLRIFSAKPGAYGVGVQHLIEKSGGADRASNVAALYAANMGFGFSGEQWGVEGLKALQANLSSIDSVQFSRSSNLYGSLDNDDSYQYVGGLRTAIQQFRKQAPDVYLHNLRQAGTTHMTALREWLAVELHSRQFNPKWIGEMKESGYAGARQISKEIEHLYGFQKTAPEHLDERTWNTVLDVFVKDRYKLGLQKFFRDQNPHAKQTILARLLEVDRQGIHHFSTADRQMLAGEYARSIAEIGAACNAQVCANLALRSHVTQQLRQSGKREELQNMEESLSKTLGKTVQSAEPAPPKPTPTPLSKLRSLQSHAITWVRRMRVQWIADSIPPWAWLAMIAAYACVIGVRMRSSRMENSSFKI
ncbi:cobaltochelatase subunit CobN [Bryobacter aggregatus]|uniref:cobaltochelatase subunit CobN n=1 Tax=Bryobacter aggregatus TaxID=360054 RepID=UPI0004E1F283|nr:cobaltochelatase subunit CobN [Bryobacter aggregatus]